MRRGLLLAGRALAGLGIIAALAAAAACTYYLNEIRIARRETAQRVAEAWQKHGRRVALSELAPARLSTLLAIEDPAFMRHHGVDLDTPGAGMTTITQGLVKQLYYPDGFEQGIAKIRQTLIAQYALDALVSKDEQLALFLNTAYLGRRGGAPVYGFAQGARGYFGKELGALSDAEFVSLVAMLPAPNRFVPGTPAHAERMRRVEAFLAGTYRPLSVLDVEYDGKRHGTPAEEALMALLRLLTRAPPPLPVGAATVQHA